MQTEEKIKKLIKSVNISTWILLAIGLLVYSPFVVQQLNSADVNVYGYLYHSGYGFEDSQGRFLLRFFDMWRNSMVSQVLVIPVSIFFVCLVGEVSCNILNINNKVSRLLLGAFLLFAPSVADLFSYTYTADSYCFSYLLAALAAYFLISKEDLGSKIIAVVLIIISLSLYQAYVGFCIFLITLWFLFKVVLKEKIKKEHILKLAFAYLSVIVGMIGYLVIFKILSKVGYLYMNTDRGFDNMGGGFISHFFEGFIDSYRAFAEYFFSTPFVNNDWFGRSYVNIVVFTAVFGLLIFTLIRRREALNWVNVIVSLAALAILPLIFCLMVFLAPGASVYAETGLLMIPFINGLYWIMVLLAEELISQNKEEIIYLILRLVSVGLIVIMVVNIQCFARLIDLEQEQLRQLSNRIVYSMESLDEYEAGGKVLVVGRPHRGNYPIPDDYLNDICAGMITKYTQIFGAEDQIASGWIRAFEYYAGVRYQAVTEDERKSLISSDEVQSMNIYPYDNSVCKIGDVVVVKLSEWKPQ